MPSHPLDLNFPPLPRTVIELEQLSTTGELKPQRLSEIVRKDPTVAMRVLRRANSSYFGIRREVSDVNHAVRLLGFRAVYELAMVEGMRTVGEEISGGDGKEVFAQLMYISSFAAYFAQHFTSELDLLEARGRTFSAGVLHTAGSLALLYSKPSVYIQLYQDAPTPLPSTAREKEAFGTDHLEVAEEACRHWSLPERLTTLVGYYHRPRELDDGRESALAAIVGAGNHLALQDVAGEKLTLPSVLKVVKQELALPGESIYEVASKAAQGAKDATEM